MFTRTANLPGVLIGVATGLLCFVLVLVYTDIPKWWFGAFAMFPTLIVGAIASLCFPRPPESALRDTLLLRKSES
jgi:ABC-type multidrug transport system permease subunit